MNWYYAEGNQQRGPLSEADFQQLVASGTVNDSTMVWHEGMANWQPYGQVCAGTMPPPPGLPSAAGPVVNDAGRQHALSRVNGPGIGLIVTAILGFIGALLNLVQIFAGESAMPALPPDLDPEVRKLFELLQGGSVGFSILSMILGIALSAVVLMGGIKLRRLESHGVVMAAAILAVIPCFNCCCVGLPVGIWALVVINAADVKPYFD